MKHFLSSIILFFIPFVIFAQFEGIVQMKTFHKANQEDATVEWKIKDGRHLMSFKSKSGAYNLNYDLLVHEKEKKVWLLGERGSEKAAYPIPYEQFDKKNNDFDLPLNSVVKKSDQKSKIAGYEARFITIVSLDVIMECWVSDKTDLTLNDLPAFMTNSDLVSILRIQGIKGVPLQFELKDAAGEILSAQYFEKIQPGTLNAKNFDFPKDYTINPGPAKK